MRLICWIGLLTFVFAACKADRSTPGKATPPGQAASSASAPREVHLRVAASSEKKEWIENATRSFAESHPKTTSGKPIVVDLTISGSGELEADIVAGKLKPAVFSPASSAYVALLNDAWLQQPTAAANAAPKPIAPRSEPLVLSPVVIAMWKPMAEALGWPRKELGWADILRVSKNPRGWAGYGHPEWGAFKLGHTHPESSNSGLLAVIAEAYAATGKTRGMTDADLASAKTKPFMAAIEGSIVHYGKSTALFTDKMIERGPAYMSAAVSYENLVIESYSKTPPMPLVAIYPVEGTFWSDHPYAVLDAPWVGAEEQAAAAAYLAFLKAKPQQQHALALGFRPADRELAISGPVDQAHGVDPKQPQTLLDVPTGEVLTHLLALWRDTKKTADVVVVFDRSASMQGRPLSEAKTGAAAFLNGLGDRDGASIAFFNHRVPPISAPIALGTNRASLLAAIDTTFADGGTALYDAIAASYDMMLAHAKQHPNRIHALVVMTDGRDENSKRGVEQLSAKFRAEDAPVKIFTIAYGSKADPRVLDDIARAAQGTSVKGSAETIVEVYRDLSAFF